MWRYGNLILLQVIFYMSYILINSVTSILDHNNCKNQNAIWRRKFVWYNTYFAKVHVARDIRSRVCIFVSQMWIYPVKSIPHLLIIIFHAIRCWISSKNFVTSCRRFTDFLLSIIAFISSTRTDVLLSVGKTNMKISQQITSHQYFDRYDDETDIILHVFAS